MKAISLWQPWASLWLTSAKVHETRSWVTKHRGPLVIHASKMRYPMRLISDPPTAEVRAFHAICARHLPGGASWFRYLPMGKLIGILSVTDVVSSNDSAPPSGSDDFLCGDWSIDRFGWRRGIGIREFMSPLEWRGRQGFFDVPDIEINRLHVRVRHV